MKTKIGNLFGATLSLLATFGLGQKATALARILSIGLAFLVAAPSDDVRPPGSSTTPNGRPTDLGIGTLFENTGSGDGPLALDSFSPPSLVAAILKQEATRLLAAYHQQQDEISDLAAARPEVGATGVVEGPKAGSIASSAHAFALADTVAPVERLQRQIRELNLTLDCGLWLLGVYAETGRDREFVDRYLHLAREAPEHGEVVVWFSTAFEAARRCERTEELWGALEHVVRFGDDAGTIRTLAGLIGGD